MNYTVYPVSALQMNSTPAKHAIRSSGVKEQFLSIILEMMCLLYVCNSFILLRRRLSVQIITVSESRVSGNELPSAISIKKTVFHKPMRTAEASSDGNIM